ncbi:putative membrane protein [Bradyrhizobium sp. USDA 4503]
MLTRGETTGAEQYTYSIAWLMFGVALLGIGIVVNSQRARLASAAVIGLTILKAFLIDMSTLTGVYRALSFMCLGIVLVAIGWLYQRILFRRRTAQPLAQAEG